VYLSHCNEKTTTLDAAAIARDVGVPISANHVGSRDVLGDALSGVSRSVWG
jgi:hypothetical protein